MHSNRRSLFAVTLAAVAFLAAPFLAVFADVGAFAVETCRRVRDWAVDIAKHALAMAPEKAEAVNPAPMQRLLAAKQYVLRFIKRETPTITDSFRLCPSI